MSKGVYCLTFPNGKRYVGMSNYSIENRWRRYKRLHCKTQPRLLNALQHYGVDNVEFKILVVCDNKEINLQLEQQLIEVWRLQDRNYGYNLTSGGECATHSEETKEKISIIHKGSKRTEEARDKMRIAATGKKFSESHKKKMSESHKGRKFSESHKRNLAIARKGRVTSEETKRKMSESQKGRKKVKSK